MNKKKLFRWIKVLVLLYCLGGIALYYGQVWLIFRPTQLPRNTPYHFEQPFTELNLNYDKHTNLNIVEFKATDRPADSMAKGVVLFFHGKTGSLSDHTGIVRDFSGAGYELWMMDFPGIGKSTGNLDEKSMNSYSLVFYKLARSRWKPEQIIISGRSIGTGPAAQLAAARDCRRLILLSPYYSLSSLASLRFPIYPVGAMLRFHFPTGECLPAVTAPVTIFQADRDRTIPPRNTERLRAQLKPGDEYLIVDGAGHNDLTSFPFYREKLDSLLHR